MAFNVVAMVSGGLDSTVSLSLLMESGMTPLPFFIHQGIDAHHKAATAVCEYYGIKLQTFDFSAILKALRKEGSNYYPAYRSYSYLTACALADLHGISTIYTGEVCSMFSSDPDSDPDYVEWNQYIGKDNLKEGWKTSRDRFTDLYTFMYKKQEEEITFTDPLWGIHKPQIAKLGVKLGTPIHLTLTCRGSEVDTLNKHTSKIVHCGAIDCWSCNQRKLAFRLANIEDPSYYNYGSELGGQYAKFLEERM